MSKGHKKQVKEKETIYEDVWLKSDDYLKPEKIIVRFKEKRSR